MGGAKRCVKVVRVRRVVCAPVADEALSDLESHFSFART